RGVLLRALLCWAIGCLILRSDEVNSFDVRFQLRGDQPISSSVTLLTIRTSDLERIYPLRSSHLISLKEVGDMSDNFFWDKNLWYDLLQRLLSYQPEKSGVTFVFNATLGQQYFSAAEAKI